MNSKPAIILSQGRKTRRRTNQMPSQPTNKTAIVIPFDGCAQERAAQFVDSTTGIPTMPYYAYLAGYRDALKDVAQLNNVRTE